MIISVFLYWLKVFYFSFIFNDKMISNEFSDYIAVNGGSILPLKILLLLAESPSSPSVSLLFSLRIFVLC